MIRGSLVVTLCATGALCVALPAAESPAAPPTTPATHGPRPGTGPCPTAAPAPPVPPATAKPSVVAAAPSAVLACIHTTPIYGATFTHWLGIARGDRRKASGRLPPATTTDADAAMQFLISAEWIIGEAAHDHLAVTANEVRSAYRAALHAQFPGLKGFHAFLRSHGETIADLKLRVRLTLLSAKLDARAEAAGPTPAKRKLALQAWISSFVARWKGETACSAAYANPDCGGTLAKT